MKTVFDILSEGLAARKTDSLLIGGHALQAYGVVRQTTDVDCLAADTAAAHIGEILTNSGYVECARTENFIRYRHPSLQLADVDVLLVDTATFGRMFRESHTYHLGSSEWHVPRLAHLIALKLHAIKNNRRRHSRDVSDIVELLRANPGAVPPDELKGLCEKHGPHGVYAVVEAGLR